MIKCDKIPYSNTFLQILYIYILEISCFVIVPDGDLTLSSLEPIFSTRHLEPLPYTNNLKEN